ncbi:MAG TPA: hypothetical protein VG295_03855 [Solirubrobacteraceae bacterium]|nr:hypothetical protein [Solirubrobacteraceae bacterium]
MTLVFTGIEIAVLIHDDVALAAVPVELQYFHTVHDEWAPGNGVVERPGPTRDPTSSSSADTCARRR